MRSDDLTPLLAAAGNGPEVRLLRAAVVAWNTTTGENTINVDGAELFDVAVVGPLTGIAAGNRVLVIATTTDVFVLGKITRP